MVKFESVVVVSLGISETGADNDCGKGKGEYGSEQIQSRRKAQQKHNEPTVKTQGKDARKVQW